jgi:hypothetical protein
MNTSLSRINTELSAQIASHVLLSNVDTGGSFALVATTLPAYDPGAPPHTHPQHAEGCYVLAGTLALTHNDQTIMLTPGTAVREQARESSILLAIMLHAASNAASQWLGAILSESGLQPPQEGVAGFLAATSWINVIAYGLVVLLLIVATRGRLGNQAEH